MTSPTHAPIIGPIGVRSPLPADYDYEQVKKMRQIVQRDQQEKEYIEEMSHRYSHTRMMAEDAITTASHQIYLCKRDRADPTNRMYANCVRIQLQIQKSIGGIFTGAANHMLIMGVKFTNLPKGIQKNMDQFRIKILALTIFSAFIILALYRKY